MDSLPTLDLSELADLVAEARAADVDGAESARAVLQDVRNEQQNDIQNPDFARFMKAVWPRVAFKFNFANWI